MAIRKAISACSAFCEIWEPQLGPTNVVLTASGEDRWKLLAIASWTLVCSAKVSFAVCTCQLALLPRPTFCTIASLPPPAVLTTRLTCSGVAAGAVNWKTEPPLNSTLSFSPRPISAAMLISRITPDIVNQSRFLATNSTDTSPRYSRPPMLPSLDITPPSGWSGLAGRPGRSRPEPGRVTGGPRVPVAEELGPGQDRDHRLGEQEHDDDVDPGGQAEREREALDVTDREVPQQRGGQERDRV